MLGLQYLSLPADHCCGDGALYTQFLLKSHFTTGYRSCSSKNISPFMDNHRVSNQDGDAFADDMLRLFDGGAGQHSLSTVRFRYVNGRELHTDDVRHL